MIIAQSFPAEGLDSGYYQPLIFIGLVYVALFIASRVLEGREDRRAETAADAAFVTILLAGAYVAILALVALASEADLVWDLIRITVIMAVFFLLVVLILFGVFEWGVGVISRLRHRGDR